MTGKWYQWFIIVAFISMCFHLTWTIIYQDDSVIDSRQETSFSAAIPPLQCDFEDIISALPDPHIWNRQWQWYFVHIPKTMGGTVFDQLPTDYRNKYGKGLNATTISEYEHKNGVQLRRNSRKTNQTLIWHPHIAHMHLDTALEMGILRCSDIDQMDIISIIREPMALLISYCKWLIQNPARTGVHNISDLIEQMRSGRRPQQSEWLVFEYDWNVTVFTMESTNQITDWFANRRMEVLFDADHHGHRSPKRVHECHEHNLDREEGLFLKRWLKNDTRLYQTVKHNGGSMRIRHHGKWLLNE